MNEPITQLAIDELAQLGDKIGQLITLCEQLRIENRSLREQHAALTSERAELLEKNTLARNHVKAMIDRLKIIESA